MNKVLIVVAHPDDEVLGCGGTIARLTSEKGIEAATLILGEGVTSRDLTRDTEKRKNELAALKKNIYDANKAIGIESTFILDFPDNRFDSVALLDIVKAIEKVKLEFMPDTIFTHFSNDMNIDHAVTNKAVLTATRPMCNETVREIYAFEVLSSTEWNFPLSFSPDYFVDISSSITKKERAMGIYTGEVREFPHPRSIKGIDLNATYWGMRMGVDKAEAFQTLRRVLPS
jgi:LmbE family N-acetylglucosaminyl deacetylase